METTKLHTEMQHEVSARTKMTADDTKQRYVKRKGKVRRWALTDVERVIYKLE